MPNRYILKFYYSDQQKNELHDESEFFEKVEHVYRRLFELYKKHKETAFGKPKKLKHGDIIFTYSVDVPEDERRFEDDDSWSVEVEYIVISYLSKKDQELEEEINWETITQEQRDSMKSCQY